MPTAQNMELPLNNWTQKDKLKQNSKCKKNCSTQKLKIT